jgi:di/tricarboxylate transporter
MARSTGASALLGGRALAMPPLVFAIAALLTAFGALGPAAVAIIAPIALRLAREHGLSPLMMGLMTIHGAQAGAFSPVSVYGGITAKVMAQSGLPQDAGFLFLASLGFNAAIAALLWLWFRRHPGEAVVPEVAVVETAALTREQGLTLLGLAALAVGTLGFKFDVGFMAVLVIVALAVLVPRAHKDALKNVDWSTVLLIAGVVTYVGVMEQIGTIDSVAAAIGLVALPLVAVLLLCWLAGIVSAFASSTALLGVIVPLAAPVLAGSGLSAVAVVAAIAISTTIVDTSPFSTNGALVVANAAEAERPALLRSLLYYSALIVVAGPLIAWAVFVASGIVG